MIHLWRISGPRAVTHTASIAQGNPMRPGSVAADLRLPRRRSNAGFRLQGAALGAFARDHA
jgi:hypothetical protein